MSLRRRAAVRFAWCDRHLRADKQRMLHVVKYASKMREDKEDHMRITAATAE
jgi:hypothetical protein